MAEQELNLDRLAELESKMTRCEPRPQCLWEVSNDRHVDGMVRITPMAHGDSTIEIHALVHEDDFGYTRAVADANGLVALRNNAVELIRLARIGQAAEAGINDAKAGRRD